MRTAQPLESPAFFCCAAAKHAKNGDFIGLFAKSPLFDENENQLQKAIFATFVRFIALQ